MSIPVYTLGEVHVERTLAGFGMSLENFGDDLRPGLVLWGLPFHELVLDHVKKLECNRVFALVSGSVARQTDSFSQLKRSLGELLVGEHIGVQNHSPWDEILEVAAAFKDVDADVMVTLGGGSVSDTAKVALLAFAHHATTLEHLDALFSTVTFDEGIGSPRFNRSPGLHTVKTPLIFVPTTLSAGEYTLMGGSTDPRNGVKYQFGVPMDPSPATVLDPVLTRSTPEWVWLSTGVRAIDHAVETLCSPHYDDDARSVASQALAAVISGLIKTKKVDWNDAQARFEAQFGARKAVDAALRLTMMGASHGIGHMLGPLCHIGHGQTSCILLPCVCRYNHSANVRQQEDAKRTVWSSSPIVSQALKDAGLDVQTADLADTLDALFRELGMPRSMVEAGVDPTEELLGKLAENSLQDFCLATNPIPLKNASQVMDILRLAARRPWLRKTGEAV